MMVSQTIQFLYFQHCHIPGRRIMIGCQTCASLTLATLAFGMPWNCLLHRYHFEQSRFLRVLTAARLESLSCLWVAQLLACEMRLRWRWQRTWRSTPHHWCMRAKLCMCEPRFWNKEQPLSCICSESFLEGDAARIGGTFRSEVVLAVGLLDLCCSPCG